MNFKEMGKAIKSALCVFFLTLLKEYLDLLRNIGFVGVMLKSDEKIDTAFMSANCIYMKQPVSLSQARESSRMRCPVSERNSKLLSLMKTWALN